MSPVEDPQIDGGCDGVRGRYDVSRLGGAWARMRAGRALCVLAVLAAVAVSLGFASSALAAEEGRITGTVTDAATQVGIEGLQVCAGLRSELFGNYCANTGLNGEYAISQVPAGAYVVEFFVPFKVVLALPSTISTTRHNITTARPARWKPKK